MIFFDLIDDIWNEGKYNIGIDVEICDLFKLNRRIKNLEMIYFLVSVNLKFKMLF